jgi:hypothetical protein
MVWVITRADSGEAALKRLLVCMKCIESLVRVIVRSRQLRSALGDSAADADFRTRFEVSHFVGYPFSSSSSYPYPTKWGRYNRIFIIL